MPDQNDNTSDEQSFLSGLNLSDLNFPFPLNGSIDLSNYPFTDFFDDFNLNESPGSELGYQKDMLMYYLMGICGMSLCCLGIIGNILSVIVLSQRLMRSSTYSYLSALALSDSFFLFMTMLLLIKDTKKPVKSEIRWMEPYYVYMFPYVHPTALTFQVTSIWLTLAFTVDRYIMICHPFKAERWCSVSRARKVICGLVTAGFLYNIPRFFEYKAEQEQFHLPADIIANFTIPSPLLIKLTKFGSSNLFREIIHSWLYLICVAGIPFLALVVLNTFLIRAVHESRKKGLQLNSKDKRRNDTTIMLIGVVIIFLLCQGPALVSRMIWALDFNAAFTSLSWYTFSEVSNFLVIINSAINIVPYYFFGKKFRRQFWRTFCSCILTKEEIRRLARSLSLTVDNRRASNISNPQHITHCRGGMGENGKKHKNSIAVPLIPNVQRSSFEELNVPPIAYTGNHDSFSSTGSGHELPDPGASAEPCKLMVNLETNGNCEMIKLDTTVSCDKCQNYNAIL
ncbi:FMRFamide receptor-like [Mizuhopecten yessoensis]|uniref:FMRFamide receptor n=1 Tax=Mizuhopecten yessoensis TaxID=6573 RepID=A0A210Q1B2_MIZYE|nr:FMRFamide receptor-like [Mizuhopecten yessoensis]XP_021369918.1 FMRFamide receptor-like [Mizuhopecten yessoensis]XP_021369919.1 FMRFamide receptor-like [Mizuhopecten yessoensis]OWF42517.1 FMRFamide receptor [Mizuhopecten yessoensis]